MIFAGELWINVRLPDDGTFMGRGTSTGDATKPTDPSLPTSDALSPSATASPSESPLTAEGGPSEKLGQQLRGVSRFEDLFLNYARIFGGTNASASCLSEQMPVRAVSLWASVGRIGARLRSVPLENTAAIARHTIVEQFASELSNLLLTIASFGRGEGIIRVHYPLERPKTRVAQALAWARSNLAPREWAHPRGTLHDVVAADGAFILGFEQLLMHPHLVPVVLERLMSAAQIIQEDKNKRPGIDLALYDPAERALFNLISASVEPQKTAIQPISSPTPLVNPLFADRLVEPLTRAYLLQSGSSVENQSSPEKSRNQVLVEQFLTTLGLSDIKNLVINAASNAALRAEAPRFDQYSAQ